MSGICPRITINESPLDRLMRGVMGVAALVAGYSWLTGVVQTVAYVVGALGIMTALTGFCLLYTVLGISTVALGKKKGKI